MAQKATAEATLKPRLNLHVESLRDTSARALRRMGGVYGRVRTAGLQLSIRALQGVRANRWFFVMAAATSVVQAILIWYPQVGVYTDMLLLAALIAGASLQVKVRRIAMSLAVIPLANAVLTATQIHNVLAALAVYDGLLAGLAIAYGVMFADDRHVNLKRFIPSIRLVPLMIVVGQLVGVLGYVFLRHHYILSTYSLPLVMASVVGFALAEELYFRNLLQKQAAKVFHPFAAACATAILFVSLTLGQSTLLSLPIGIALAAALAFTYYRTKSVLATTVLNMVAKLVYVGLVATYVLR
jgi:membrane protease YdiL (CAAX protease family)